LWANSKKGSSFIGKVTGEAAIVAVEMVTGEKGVLLVQRCKRIMNIPWFEHAFIFLVPAQCKNM